MHVLLATDGSQQSLEAARFLGKLVNPSAIEKITIIAVIRPLAAVPFAHDLAGEQPAGSTEAFALSFRREAQAAAELVAAALQGKAPQVDTVVRSGSPADEIIRAANEIKADLIVVGGQGQSAMGAILLGSVAYRVLHHALCPVLVAR